MTTVPRMLGDAFVVINPDTSHFRADAERQIKQALAGLKPVIPLGVDVEGTFAQIRLLQQRIRQAGLADFLDVNIPTGRLITQVQLIKRLLSQAKIADLLEVNLDRASLARQLAVIQNLSQTIPVRFDVGKLPVVGPFQSVRVPVVFDVGKLPVLGPTSNLSERFNINTTAAQASLANLSASFRDTGSTAAGFDTELKSKPGDLAAAGTAAAGLKGGLAGLAAGFAAGGGAIGGWGGALTATIPVLGLTIKSVAFWHIVLDLAIEALIAVGLAAVAAAPALLVLANIGQDLSTHFQAVRTVFESLHQAVGPLTGQFDQLAHAMAPQAIEIFGGAMNVVSGKAGLFNDAATRVITLLDTWVAKIDIWANAQSQMGKFITAGIGYLSQFAAIIGNVVSALGNLLTKDPGIARYLLDIVNGAALLLKAFSDLPGPVVYAALALHGIYVWGSVIAPLLIRLAAYVLGLGAAFLELAANPFTWVAAAVIALAALAYESTQASSSAKAFAAAINQQIANDTATKAILDIAAATGQFTQQIQATTGPVNAMKQWNAQSESLGGGFQRLGYNLRATGSAFGKAFGDIPQSLSSFGALGRTVKDFGHAIADFFSSSSGASVMASNNIKFYDAQINSLISQQGVLFRVAGLLVTGNNALTKSSYSLAAAFALEDLAGVRAGDSFAVARQKVANLITGYQDMSVQGGILLNSVNAITFASLQQQSGIANLNSGWTAFIGTVTGGASAFDTFQKQVYTISQALTGIAPAASKGAASIGGLNTASLDANSAFIQGVTNANSLVNALTLQASAAGLGARGTDMLTAAVKDTVAQLIPMAGGSKAAQAALIALAQQGGAPANISFQGLSKWVGTASGTMAAAGKSGGPAAQLQAIMGTLATAASNLTTDVQNLSIALGTQLTQAESAAILLARGGTKPFDDFANAIAHTGVNSKTTRDAAVRLGDEFLALSNNNVPAAKAQFEAFARYGLGLTQQAADALWNDVLQHGIPALNQMGSAADNIKSNHLAPLGVGVDTVAGKVANLSRYLLAVPSSVRSTVTVQGSGTGGINLVPTPSGLPSGNVRFTQLAGGGIINQGSGPTADDVIVRVSRGETIVSAADSKRLAGVFAAAGIPGYAYGGITGAGLPRVPGFLAGIASADAGAIELAFAKALVAKDQAALNAQAAAAQSALGFALLPGGGSVSGSAAAAQAWARGQLAAGIYGWGLNSWPSLLALWNQESGWMWNALNASSGAYGIPQSLPADKMAAAGPDWRTNPVTQMRWGMAYIRCMPVSNTEILTRDGWKHYENVQVGDETIGYNLETGRSEWTVITHINFYGKAPLVRLRNKTLDAVCTPNHRWVTSHVRQVENRRMINGVRDPALSTSYRVDELTAANRITSRHSLRLAAPSDTGDGPAISPGEAELLGWVMGDGSILNPGTRTHTGSPLAGEIYRVAQENPAASNRAISRIVGCDHKAVTAYLRARGEIRRGSRSVDIPMRKMSLCQSRPQGIRAIDGLLAAEGIPSRRYVRPAQGIGKLPRVDWHLTQSYTEELLKRSGYDHRDPVPFVLSLSGPQREAFLRGVFGAEGHAESQRMIMERGPYAGDEIYSQADGPQQDVIVLALYLSGRRPAIRNWSTASRAGLGSRTGANIVGTKPFIGGGHTRCEDAGQAEVWCPTTELGSWTARQGRQVFLTGNSTYGDPISAENHERAFNWYAQGGLVGAASGGSVRALREKLAREQAGERMKYFGLLHSFAIGPAKYRTRGVMSELGELAGQQKAELAAYAALAGSGLTTGHLARLAGVARAESRTAGGWWLRHMPGGHPLFAQDLRRYLGLLAGTTLPAGATGVLGNDFAQLPLPAITHTYGAVTDVIEAYLQAHAAPFGKARGGLVMSYDRGNVMPPGLSLSWNGTGRPESLVPAAPATVTLQVSPGGSSAFDRFMTSWLREHVKVKGGGNVQKAWGSRLRVSL